MIEALALTQRAGFSRLARIVITPSVLRLTPPSTVDSQKLVHVCELMHRLRKTVCLTESQSPAPKYGAE